MGMPCFVSSVIPVKTGIQSYQTIRVSEASETMHPKKSHCNCYAMFYNDLDPYLSEDDSELVDCFVLISNWDYECSVSVLSGSRCSSERC